MNDKRACKLLVSKIAVTCVKSILLVIFLLIGTPTYSVIGRIIIILAIVELLLYTKLNKSKEELFNQALNSLSSILIVIAVIMM